MASLLHPFTNLTVLRQTGPLVLERGKGVFVYGADGRDYLEAMGGLWCTALGWGEEELVRSRGRADAQAVLRPYLRRQEP